MFFYLIVSLVILLFFCLIFNKGRLDFSDPTLLLCSSFVLSAIFVLVNYNNWEVEQFSFNTVKIICLFLIFFIVGGLVGNFFYKLIPKNKKFLIQSSSNGFILKGKDIMFSSILIILSASYYFIQLKSESGIPFNGLIPFMTAIRESLKENLISISFLSAQVFSFSKGLGYVFTYCFLWELVKNKNRKVSLLIVPMLYLAMSLLTSGRIYLIYYMIFLLGTFFLFFDYKNQKISTSVKYLFICIAYLLLGLITFGSIANLVGRNTKHSVFVQLSVYIGGPLISLNKFLETFNFQKSSIFGEETLVGLYQILNKLGISNVVLNRHLEYISFGNNWGNVYTAIRRYMSDFGLLGTLGLILVIGFLYTFIHQWAKNKISPSFAHILFCYSLYSIPMMVIDDTLLSNFISVNTIYDLLYLYIIFAFIKKYKLVVFSSIELIKGV